MSFAIASGAVGLLGAGASLITGLGQKKQGQQLAANNPYPQQQVPQAEKDNQQIAAQMANEGLPSQQYAMAMKNIDRSRSAAMRDAYDRRAGVGLIGQIQQNTNDAKAKLDVANANARIQNQRTLLGVNNKVAGYQQDAFNWNAKNKYNQDYNYSQQLKGAGNANVVHSFDQLGSGLLQGASMGLFGGGRYGYGSGAGAGQPGAFNSPNTLQVNGGTAAPNTGLSSSPWINPDANGLTLSGVNMSRYINNDF